MSDDILTRIDEAVAEATSCFCGCGTVLKARNPSLWFASEECQARWGERRLAAERGKKPRESALVAATPAPPVHPASPYLTREDITGQPDRVGDALRAEVLRQGLTECEVDGQPWAYRDGQWASSRMEVRHEGPWTVIDETHVWLPAPGPLLISDTEPSARLPWWKRLLP